MRTLLLAAAASFAAALPAQYTILMTSGSSTENTLGLDPFEIDLIRNDEIYEVTPALGVPYTARPFLPISLAWFYVGDQDNDAHYVDAAIDGPGGQIDEIFVKANTFPTSPRDVFFSISATAANLPGVTASDVVRFAGQGTREVFLTDAQLMAGTGGTSLNLDALAQSTAGDLFFSFSLTETTSAGSVDDGDLLMIPASAITYDALGNVSVIAPGSVQVVATQAQLLAMIINTGFRTSVGGAVTPTSSFELSGLEIDPNGGTFVSPSNPSLVLPNLLFCWNDFSNDGAIISTANGGSIAVINGVTMGSTVATQGDQIGWQPTSTGVFGPGGLALMFTTTPSYTMLNFPRNLHTAGDGQTVLQLQVSGGTPFGASALALSPESAIAGGGFPALPTPFGELGMTGPIVVGLGLHDALGNCTSPLFVLSTTAFAGLNLTSQALDLTSFRLSTPGGISFL